MEKNNFRTKADYQKSLTQMCHPLVNYYSEGKANVQTGHTAAHYGTAITGLEGFSRLLWGLVPLWKGGGESCLDHYIIQGIRNGTNQNHAEYWGDYQDGEQAYVEMAALAFGIWMTPEKIWEPLKEPEKQQFQDWLLQINEHKISDNNWLFFRVLVNCGLRKVKASYSQEQIEKDLNRIDEFYLGEGWYCDGETMQRDYYIGFAMHFYSLLYVGLMGAEDAGRCEKYKERACLFAKDYVYWFGEKGEALPYGRSLTYRFAQAGFWCALAFAEVEALPWGEIKGIVNRHFRYWFSHPILDSEDKLTLGYAYPNLTVCEGYNSPNSPYWAWKSFLILSLKEEHPFWSAEELPLPKVKENYLQKHPGMLFQRGTEGYVTALVSGQYAEWEPVHCAEKYAKFAYSSYFGFQTPRSYCRLEQLAPDNMIAFFRDGYYHIRRRCIEVVYEQDRIYSSWIPMEGVEVETQLIPMGKGHLRIHTIQAVDACTAVEGGFALFYEEPKELVLHEKTGAAMAIGQFGSSKIELRQGQGEGQCVICEANVNLLHPRTVLPCLKYEIPKGNTQISVYVEGIPINLEK